MKRISFGTSRLLCYKTTILSNPDSPLNHATYTTLTSKHDIEDVIILRNQKHSRQSLNTPFAANKLLKQAIDPLCPNNKIDEILQGVFLDNYVDDLSLSDIEKAWIQELQSKIDETVNIQITVRAK
jgi:hypothetical protein